MKKNERFDSANYEEKISPVHNPPYLRCFFVDSWALFNIRSLFPSVSDGLEHYDKSKSTSEDLQARKEKIARQEVPEPVLTQVQAKELLFTLLEENNLKDFTFAYETYAPYLHWGRDGQGGAEDTVLFVAIDQNKTEFVQTILMIREKQRAQYDKQLDILFSYRQQKVKDIKKVYPLDLALLENKFEIAQLLLEAGAANNNGDRKGALTVSPEIEAVILDTMSSNKFKKMFNNLTNENKSVILQWIWKVKLDALICNYKEIYSDSPSDCIVKRFEENSTKILELFNKIQELTDNQRDLMLDFHMEIGKFSKLCSKFSVFNFLLLGDIVIDNAGANAMLISSSDIPQQIALPKKLHGGQISGLMSHRPVINQNILHMQQEASWIKAHIEKALEESETGWKIQTFKYDPISCHQDCGAGISVMIYHSEKPLLVQNFYYEQNRYTTKKDFFNSLNCDIGFISIMADFPELHISGMSYSRNTIYIEHPICRSIYAIEGLKDCYDLKTGLFNVSHFYALTEKMTLVRSLLRNTVSPFTLQRPAKYPDIVKARVFVRPEEDSQSNALIIS
ncbi:MAG: hypothetical protein HKM04_08780 [Legionellales bacterium]|nr:hypothetical protein [Legionellales bacterium]